MKRAIDIGPVDAAAIRTRGGKVRLRLHFSVEQLEAMLRAAMAEDAIDDEEADSRLDNMKRSVTQCNAPEEDERRSEDDGGDARARAAPDRVFVIEGTRAWKAWLAHRRRGLPTCDGHGPHAGKRGWYMPTLFPPGELAPEDSEALANL